MTKTKRPRKLGAVQQLIFDTVTAGGYVVASNSSSYSESGSTIRMRARQHFTLKTVTGRTVRKLTEFQVKAAQKRGHLKQCELPRDCLLAEKSTVQIYSTRVAHVLKSKKRKAGGPLTEDESSTTCLALGLLLNARNKERP